MGAAAGVALLGLALLAGFTALPRGGPRATVLDSVEAAAQHAAGGKSPLHGARRAGRMMCAARPRAAIATSSC
jgi:hypothetical protein